MLVTSFGPNPFGKGTMLRLWEQAGDAGKCTVTLPEGMTFTRAVPVNLRGEKAGNAILLKIILSKLNWGHTDLQHFYLKNKTNQK